MSPQALELRQQADRHALRGAHAEAVAAYDRALALDPGEAWTRNNRALSLTALGRIREAWAEAEVRFELQDKTRRFWAAPPCPRWEGARIEGRLLVLWEQGFGDMLQHLRFLSPAAQRTQGLAFLCPPALKRLVAASFPEMELLDPKQPVAWSSFSACIALLSLPFALGTDWDSLPATPYFRVVAKPRTGGLGVVWRSSAFDPSRNCSLEALLPLRESGLRLVSLQVDPTEEERVLLRTHGIPGRAGTDFYGTAEEMAQLDAVVSVDTAPAHLAGGLGLRTFVLLNEPAAVRWMQHREDTPWYPGMRLLRKRPEDPWASLVARVRQELHAIAA